MKIYLTLLLTSFALCSQAQDFKLVVKENAANIIMLDYDGDNGENVFFGKDAGGNSTGNFVGGNTFIGRHAGKVNTSGRLNTYIGKSAGEVATGSKNTAMGSRAGEKAAGDDNVYIGNSTGIENVGDRNTMLGAEAGQNNTGSNNVFLGFKAGHDQAGSSQLMIESQFSEADSTEVLIYGKFDTDELRFNAHTDIYSDATLDEGLYVEKTHTGASDIPAISGVNNSTDYYGIGVEGQGGWIGVRGSVTGTSNGEYTGVLGSSLSPNIGTNVGVYGAASNGSENYAGYFDGTVRTDAVQFGSDTKQIKKTTSLKYYIAVEGAYPSFTPGDPAPTGTIIGEIKMFAYPASFGNPTGWLECDGSLINIADYSTLFSLLATTYGGNGTTTFGVPDMREAVPHHGM